MLKSHPTMQMHFPSESYIGLYAEQSQPQFPFEIVGFLSSSVLSPTSSFSRSSQYPVS